MTAVTAYIAIGANLNPEANILAGLEKLNRRVAVTRVSRFYRTAPLDRDDQPDFLNGVCAVRTALGPRQLKFQALRPIERALGRLRTPDRHAPRPLDLDILLYGDRIIREPDLHIPDPDLTSRPFVFIPLLEVAGNIRLPQCRIELAKHCNQSSYRYMIEDEHFTQRVRKRFPGWVG